MLCDAGARQRVGISARQDGLAIIAFAIPFDLSQRWARFGSMFAYIRSGPDDNECDNSRANTNRYQVVDAL